MESYHKDHLAEASNTNNEKRLESENGLLKERLANTEEVKAF